MTIDPVLVTVTATVAAGVACQALARRLRVPAILPLLFAGILLGPDLIGLVQPDELGAGLRVLVGFAVAIILFEGGLSLKTEAFLFSGKLIRNLVLVGSLITGCLAAGTALLLFPELGAGPAVLFGALVIVTGPTVIQPLLKVVHPRKRLADVLRGEAILIDPVGALLAVLVLEFLLEASHGGTTQVITAFLGRILLGFLLGAGGAVALQQLIKRPGLIPRDLRNLLVLAAALTLYTISETVSSESGVLTVTVAGLFFGWLRPPGLHEIEEFKGTITVLMVSTVFVLLSANLHLADMQALGSAGIALVLVLILVVRPVSVFLCAIGTGYSWREKVFLSWIAPRGIVAAAVSSLFALLLERNGMQGGREVMAMTFAVIVGTVLVQAPTARFVGRRLRVLQERRNGFLIIGAGLVARCVAGALHKSGLPLVMIDTNHWNVKRAREQGLNARVGNAVDELLKEGLDLDVMGALIALTPSDAVNRAALRLYEREFEANKVRAIRLNSSPDLSDDPDAAPYLFEGRLGWEEFRRALEAGSSIEKAEVDEPIQVSELGRRVEGAIALFAFDEGEEIRFLGDGDELETGETLYYLAPPGGEEAAS